MNMLEELKQKFEDPSFRKRLDEAALKYANEENIITSQLERFHKRILDGLSFEETIEKIQKKYSSNEYYNRWMNIGILPPKDLLFFLYRYARVFGRDCTENEYEILEEYFSSTIYFIHDYYFQRIDGQGSFIRIIKGKL